MASFDQKKTDRINELARAAKQRELTEEERAERQQLRKEFIENFRRGFEDKLNHMEILEPDGTVRKVKKKKKKRKN